ncbi:hypothetical protein [Arcanobacterium ihumii]|uniref:hypothetical protein n=1 Tax=Arcanobacterium ihumii TaxID=2138162 RepID=UPI00190F855A|nr:hypothetical protein [Arcanobacterium ihumii]
MFILLAGCSLLAGLNAALLKLGQWAPVEPSQDPAGGSHGLVMTLGFLGTLISLERAQALASKDQRCSWAYLAPGLFGLGGIVAALGGSPSLIGTIGQILLVEAAVIFVLIYASLWKRASLTLIAVQILAAVTCFAAALLSLFSEVHEVIPLLACYLIVTIASERAELAQLSMGPRAVPVLLWMSSLLTLTSVIALLFPSLGNRLFGVMQFLIALWLLKDDVPRYLIKSSGLHKFTATSLLMGYMWLIVGGVTWVITAGTIGSVYYDVVIHTVFIGFGFSMIMAHAPIIFPTVMGVPVPFKKLMYIPLILLHSGLAIRVAGELLLGQTGVWKIGGTLNVIAVLAFMVSVVYSILSAKLAKAKRISTATKTSTET